MACATYIKVEKYIEFANGVHNLHQGANGAHTGKQQIAALPLSPAVQVTGSANALSRWDWAQAPLGGV